jgi:hypothetical protein
MLLKSTHLSLFIGIHNVPQGIHSPGHWQAQDNSVAILYIIVWWES